MTDNPSPEFSVIRKLTEINPSVEKGSIAANAEQRTALAKRFSLRSIQSLNASFALRPQAEKISFSGTISSNLIQICAISGQDLPIQLNEKFDIAFIHQIAPTLEEQEIELTADDCDVVDFDGQQIDLGEAIAQTLFLALDPYARAPNAQEVAREKGLKSAEEVGPFSALAALKDKLS
jgi:uncharacterized metal-binding protein YceD (DUF177 family)